MRLTNVQLFNRYKEGPLVKLPPNNVEPDTIEKLKLIKAKGVIFELPADKTYLVDTVEVQNYVKNLVENFRNSTINVILDLTPNFVTTEDELYRLALNDTKYRSAFVWIEGHLPPKWISKVAAGSAWKEVKAQNWVLSQFGVNNIDLQLSDPTAREKLRKVLETLVDLGVNGFRLANAKHYIINSKDLKDESPSGKESAVHSEYDFWNHQQTTFQPGLPQLFEEFSNIVKNYTKNEGFLSVSDDIERPEVFSLTPGHFGFDLPIHTVLPQTLATAGPNVAKQLFTELNLAVNNLGVKTWPQWVYSNTSSGLSEYSIFLFLLPGVPVGTIDNFVGTSQSDLHNIQVLEEIRAGASYQHGTFDVYFDANQSVVAYSR